MHPRCTLLPRLQWGKFLRRLLADSRSGITSRKCGLGEILRGLRVQFGTGPYSNQYNIKKSVIYKVQWCMEWCLRRQLPMLASSSLPGSLSRELQAASGTDTMGKHLRCDGVWSTCAIGKLRDITSSDSLSSERCMLLYVCMNDWMKGWELCLQVCVALSSLQEKQQHMQLACEISCRAMHSLHSKSTIRVSD